jgi:glycerol-3-phosphate cytidylyltransferase
LGEANEQQGEGQMKTGFTCSTFDLLHAGHITMLREAKSVCDYLIVGLQTDPSIDGRKPKPVQSVYERYIQLEACKYVDEIIPYDTESDLMNLLVTLPIDIRIIGSDYETKDFTGDSLEIPLHYNRRDHSWSSSSLKRRIIES